MEGQAKLTLLIEMQNRLSMGLNKAKEQVKKATGDMEEKIKSFKNNAKAAFEDLKSSIPGLSNALHLLKNPIALIAAGFTAAIATVKKFIDYTSTAIEAYKKQNVAETKLDTLMRLNMKANDEQIQGVKDFMDAQQKLGVVSRDVQAAGAAELTTYLKKEGSIQKLLPSMNDLLAHQYGLNASQEGAVSVAQMVGKVLDGQTGALSRAGFTFTEAQERVLKYGKEQQKVAVLTKVFQKYIGGVNEALANTPEGKFKQLENEMGDLDARMGEVFINLKTAFLPVYDLIYKLKLKFAEFFENNKEAIQSVIQTIVSWIITLKNRIISAFSFLKQAFMFIYEWRAVIYGVAVAFAVLNAKIIAAAVVTGALAIKTELLAAKNGILAAKQWLVNVAMTANPIGIIIMAIGIAIGVIVTCYKKFDKFRATILGVWEVVKGFGEVIKTYIIDRIVGVIKGLGLVGKAIGKLFKGDFSGAWKDTKEGVMELSGANAMKNAIEGTKNLKNNFTSAYDNEMAASAQKKKEDEKAKAVPKDSTGATIKGLKDDNTKDTPTSDDTQSIKSNSQTKNIKVTIDALMKNVTINRSETADMNDSQLESWLTERLMRSVRSIELMA